MRFDLITVDVVEPRDSAAEVVSEDPELSIELDEDEGRWLVVSSVGDHRRFGLQRSDAREVSARVGAVGDVIDGCITLPALDVATALDFYSAAAGLTIAGNRLERAGTTVITFVDAPLRPSNLHLDFACEPAEFAHEADHLLDLGASRIGPLRSAAWGTSQIFAAPAGGVFCLNAYAD